MNAVSYFDEFEKYKIVILMILIKEIIIFLKYIRRIKFLLKEKN